MRTFINVEDLGGLSGALAEAKEIKQDRYKYQQLGKNKTLLMIFFNNSLRTRLSTQKAATNLGMNVIVLDVNAGAWKLETERGVIMDGDKSEHLLEAIPVMGCYCDIIGVRSFAGLTDREYDYAETVLQQFIRYSGRPVFAMETATVHPLQAFADFYGVTLDYLTHDQSDASLHEKGRISPKDLRMNKIILTALAIVLVFSIATVIFAATVVMDNVWWNGWLAFVWAVPVSFLCLISFNRRWGRREWGLPLAIVFVWTFLFAVYIELAVDLDYDSGYNLWFVLLLGIPLTLGIFLFWRFRELHRRSRSQEENANK